MKLYLSADALNFFRWWVDDSYGTRCYCRRYTGAVMSMGKGEILSFSKKKKLNTASSTEAGVVEIADALGFIIWVKYFMEAQGYTIDINILFQDNKSTILLAKNGRSLAGKNSKHINNCYFLITDKVQQGDLEIQHKPTG